MPSFLPHFPSFPSSNTEGCIFKTQPTSDHVVPPGQLPLWVKPLLSFFRISQHLRSWSLFLLRAARVVSRLCCATLKALRQPLSTQKESQGSLQAAGPPNLALMSLATLLPLPLVLLPCRHMDPPTAQEGSRHPLSLGLCPRCSLLLEHFCPERHTAHSHPSCRCLPKGPHPGGHH